jgi:hypothetical protein
MCSSCPIEVAMPQDLTPHVRERAYYLWEKAGGPYGREHEFWAQASHEIEGEKVLMHKTSDGRPALRKADEPAGK